MKIISSIKINSLTERQLSGLSILPPQAITLPGICITVNVKSGDKNPVKVIHNAVDVCVCLPIAFNQGVCQIAHGGNTDPFAGMGGAGDDDGHFFVLGGCFGSYFQSVYLAAFVTSANGSDFYEARKKRFEEFHPWKYYSGGLVTLEEEIICSHLSGFHVFSI